MGRATINYHEVYSGPCLSEYSSWLSHWEGGGGGGGGWKGLWNCRAAKAEDVYQCHVNELIRLASLCDSSHKTCIQF